MIKLSFLECDFHISSKEPFHFHWLKHAHSSLLKLAIIDQASGAKLNNIKLLTSVIIFIKRLKAILVHQENIGVLLPSSAVGAIVNLALFALGKKTDQS
ncbi:hypothetical protein AGMMS50229_08210 [Campylobacterota bacterium]|nr:hypothetical protein AGMMS50229_08210 [Campylobacterota bacterium]